MQTLSERIDASLEGYAPGKSFLECDGQIMTFGQLGAGIAGLRGVFASRDLSPGARIGVLAHHPADVAAITLAAFRAGVAVVVLNPEFTADEVARAYRDCTLSTLFCDTRLRESLPEESKTDIALFRAWPGKGGGGGLLGRLRERSAPKPEHPTLEEMAAKAPEVTASADLSGDTVALLLNTSGTTSAPKVVELTHAALAHQFEAFNEVYDFDGESRILNPLPLHFTDGLFHGPLNAFISGATLYRPVDFDIGQLEDLLNGIYRDRITHLIVVPAILALMDRLGNEFTDSFQTDDFRFIRCSGDRLPPALWTSVQDRFKVQVVNTYGMSETVCEAFYCGPDPESFKVGTIGKAVGCDWRIVDEADTAVATGETGELHLKGGIITAGYAGQPEMTRDSFDDGWFRTGDLATADTDGFVSIVGRSKDLIIAGGVNVQPQEIVDCLLTHDAVAEAVAFGLPHGVWGEQIAVAVVPAPGAAPDRSDILAHCRAELAPHKTPRIVHFLPELPRNPAGKVLVRELMDTMQSSDTSRGSSNETGIAEQVLMEAAEVFGVDVGSLHASARSEDIVGWDSFAHLTLIMALETRFNITLSARDVLRVDRLADLIDIISQKVT